MAEEFLGVLDKKEYFSHICLPDELAELRKKDRHCRLCNEDGDSVVVWRVPDPREAVRAPKGRKIFSADLSQIEVKIMTWLSQDPFLRAAINSGQDVHCYMTAEIFEIPYDTIWRAVKNICTCVDLKIKKDRPKRNCQICHGGDFHHELHDDFVTMRSNVKTVTFGIPYGATAPKVAEMTGKTEEEAQELIDRYFVKAKVLKQWLDRVRRKAIEDKYSLSGRGRRRWYELPERSEIGYRRSIAQIERYAGNHPIQSTCSDLLKTAMALFYNSMRGCSEIFEATDNATHWRNQSSPLIYDGRTLLAVHDEIVGECAEELAGTSKRPGPVPLLLKSCMEYVYNQMSMDLREYDALEDKWVTRKSYLNELINKVDVVVGDYWAKE